MSNTEKVKNYRKRVKWNFIQAFGGKCSKCPYNKPVPTAYHFHHRDPKTKSFEIGGSTLGFDRLVAEAKKCDLHRANCHAEAHDKAWVEARMVAYASTRATKTKVIPG